jgi:hypothetical protein
MVGAAVDGNDADLIARIRVTPTIRGGRRGVNAFGFILQAEWVWLRRGLTMSTRRSGIPGIFWGQAVSTP